MTAPFGCARELLTCLRWLAALGSEFGTSRALQVELVPAPRDAWDIAPLSVKVKYMNWSFRRAMQVWWGFLWRSVIYGVLAGTPIRFSVYVAGRAWGMDMQGNMYIASIVTILIYLPITFVALKQSLSRNADW